MIAAWHAERDQRCRKRRCSRFMMTYTDISTSKILPIQKQNGPVRAIYLNKSQLIDSQIDVRGSLE